MGRFISEDPLRFGTNFYGYAFERPTNLADPLGLCPCSKPAAGPTPVPWAGVDKNIHLAMETAANEPPDYSVPWFVWMVEKGGAWDYNSFYPPGSNTIADQVGSSFIFIFWKLERAICIICFAVAAYLEIRTRKREGEIGKNLRDRS